MLYHINVYYASYGCATLSYAILYCIMFTLYCIMIFDITYIVETGTLHQTLNSRP